MRAFVLLSLLVATTGCKFNLFGDGGDDVDVQFPRSDSPSASPPTLEVDIPGWPPLGAASTIRVSATHDGGLGTIQASFTESVTGQLSGFSDTLTLRASSLGEGFGRLEVRLNNFDGSSATAFVEDLLIDLSPPVITSAGPALAGAGQRFRVRVEDAWVLGQVDVEVGGSVLREQLPPGFPASFSQAWDAAEFALSLDDVPEGEHLATIRVEDAAGNIALERMMIEVDRTAPGVYVEASQAGDVIEVAVRADGRGPSWMTVEVLGTAVAEVAGPEGRVRLDANEFPAGPMEISARARDAAGNWSDAATIILERR